MTTLTLDRRAITLGLAGVLCMPAILRAQTSYPDRPINLIVPFAAGGPTDAIARIYAEFISRDLGQTMVIETSPAPAARLARPARRAPRPTATPSRSARPALMSPASGSTRT
jgi:tripartite-type tricarboxylate transporter receptor subunit TctC